MSDKVDLCTSNNSLVKINCVVVGEARTGKTEWIYRLTNRKDGDVYHYRKTVSMEYTPYIMPTNNEVDIQFNFWDFGSESREDPMRKEIYEKADYAIIMIKWNFDYHKTIENMYAEIESLRKVNPKLPILILNSEREYRDNNFAKNFYNQCFAKLDKALNFYYQCFAKALDRFENTNPSSYNESMANMSVIDEPLKIISRNILKVGL